MTYEYKLRIEGLNPDEIREQDPDVWDEITFARDSQDSDVQAVLRWLGGFVDEAENTVGSELPEGWYVKLEGGETYIGRERVRLP